MAVRMRHCIFSVNSWQEIWESSGDEELSLGNLRNSPVHRWGHLTVHLWKWTVGVNHSWLSTSSCPAPPQHGAHALYPKHLPEGGWWCLLRESSRNRPDFGKQASSRGSQTWLYWAITWELLKDTDAWAHPWRFSFNWSGWGPRLVFLKSSSGDSNVQPAWEPCCKWIGQNVPFLLRWEKSLVWKGLRAGSSWSSRPRPMPEGPSRTFTARQESTHLNCKGPGSKYVRFHGPSGVCQSYFNSAAEVEKQPQTCVNEWAQLCSKETSSTELKCEFHTIFLFDSFFQPFKNVKPILSSCTRYQKWWYGFGLPALCSKRWAAATVHSLMDGKSLPTPSRP